MNTLGHLGPQEQVLNCPRTQSFLSDLVPAAFPGHLSVPSGMSPCCGRCCYCSSNKLLFLYYLTQSLLFLPSTQQTLPFPHHLCLKEWTSAQVAPPPA